MNKFLEYSEKERKKFFQTTATKLGIHEAIIEKDYWICLVLDSLFHKCEYKEYFAFKGGTSLSKCFNVIQRFSEDIDLIFNWTVLGYSEKEPWEERSNNKQFIFNTEVNEKTGDFLTNKFVPVISRDLEKIAGTKIKVEIDENESQIVNVYYPKLFDIDSILPVIRLEIGALAAWTPTVNMDITPYIFECYPDIVKNKDTNIITTAIERTFWEKATILHHEANRPKDSAMPVRYARHYYDLYCLAKSQYKSTALSDFNLLKEVVKFKQKFYARKWANYDEAAEGKIKLVPPEYRLKELEKDYVKMTSMIFGDYPTFEDMMTVIAELETEIHNNLAVL